MVMVDHVPVMPVFFSFSVSYLGLEYLFMLSMSYFMNIDQLNIRTLFKSHKHT